MLGFFIAVKLKQRSKQRVHLVEQRLNRVCSTKYEPGRNPGSSECFFFNKVLTIHLTFITIKVVYLYSKVINT
jgi:hypothetical protein